MYSASANHPHCCNELLLRGADIAATNHCDDTAFSLAVDHKSSLGKVSRTTYAHESNNSFIFSAGCYGKLPAYAAGPGVANVIKPHYNVDIFYVINKYTDVFCFKLLCVDDNCRGVLFDSDQPRKLFLFDIS